MRKVVKFGGTSLADAHQFEKAGGIVRAESSRRYVVPSAPGKRFAGFLFCVISASVLTLSRPGVILEQEPTDRSAGNALKR